MNDFSKLPTDSTLLLMIKYTFIFLPILVTKKLLTLEATKNRMVVNRMAIMIHHYHCTLHLTVTLPYRRAALVKFANKTRNYQHLNHFTLKHHANSMLWYRISAITIHAQR